MKTETIVLVGVAAVAAYFLLIKKPTPVVAAPPPPAPAGQNAAWATVGAGVASAIGTWLSS